VDNDSKQAFVIGPAVLVYLLVAALLLVMVATTLVRFSEPFLCDIFVGDAKVARATNRLVVLGVFLSGVGIVALLTPTDSGADDVLSVIDVVASRVGATAVLLAIIVFALLGRFIALRRQTLAHPSEQTDYEQTDRQPDRRSVTVPFPPPISAPFGRRRRAS
jgi:hypothetical protein